MSRFRGSFVHTLDAKGRLSIPSKFRNILKEYYGSEKLVLTYRSRCLETFPLSEWEKMEDRVREKLDLVPFADPSAVAVTRALNASAQECDVDRLGRILVSKALRAAASLGNEVRIVGMNLYFEIWDHEKLAEDLERNKTIFSGGAVQS